MEIKVIASGSSGNSYHISDGASSLLLDAGVPLPKIQEGCGYRVSELSGCLITHGHGDHVKAATALSKLGVNIYTSQGTIDMAKLTGHRIKRVEARKAFQVGSFTVLPFDVEHDAPETLGFLVQSTVTGEKLLYVTDTMYLRYTFVGLTHIMIEANYDPEVMAAKVRDGELNTSRAKRTIGSHMSIETTIKTLNSIGLSKVKQIYLLHLSGDNSKAEDFRHRVQALTGKEVYVY